jgi:hypothetical protein
LRASVCLMKLSSSLIEKKEERTLLTRPYFATSPGDLHGGLWHRRVSAHQPPGQRAGAAAVASGTSTPSKTIFLGLHTGRIPTLVTRRVCNCVCVSGPHSVPALSPCAHILATVVQTVWYPWRVRSHPPMTWWRTVRSSSCRLTRHPTHLLRPAPAPWDQHSRVHGSP